MKPGEAVALLTLWMVSVAGCTGGTPDDPTDAGSPTDVAARDIADLPDCCVTDLPFEPAGPTEAPEPMFHGPFEVGVTTVDFFDDTRPHPDTGAPRFLRTEIWYPAAQSVAGDPTWSYDIRIQGLDPNIDLGGREAELVATDIGLFHSPAVRDAEPDREHALPFPVILFSHGAYSTRFQYNFLTVHLASHGYVVVAPDHQGNTLWDMIRDGFDLQVAVNSIDDRVADLPTVLSGVAGLGDDPAHLLGGLLDADRVGVSGHSLGGYTALVAADRDASLSPVVGLSPLMIPMLLQLHDCQLPDLLTPSLILGAPLDQTIAYQEQYCGYRTIGASTKYLYEVTDGGHFTFTDMCSVDLDAMPTVPGTPDMSSDGCSDATNVDPVLAQLSINHYATALFNVWLRDSPGSESYLTDSTEPPFDVGTLFAGDDLPDWPTGCGP